MEKQFSKYGRLSLLILPMFDSIYFRLDHPRERVYNLVTSFDQRIPFIKFFALPYIVWYPFVILTLAWLMKREPRLYVSTLIACLMGLALSYSFYILAQTTTPRPQIIGNDWLTRIVLFIYHMDEPYNSFPSIHVLISFILFQAGSKLKIPSPFFTGLVRVVAGIIILSTLFIKQHTLLDVAGGIGIGSFLFWLVEIVSQKIEQAIFLS
ncbi:phosphatase PAP2 family protein [Desulfosporosinus sp. FKB]|uniref:phosphatase PAP2 family protein n=1 Tax=Desulfosporosinus sp. FKB TaxID=1969835 RepID=UPI000B497F25|nr:phosphatase PAP2 family protein [Desulfosporosinus sp. FKB]